LQAQGITNVVESDAVGELRIDQLYAMTPGTEGAGSFSHLGCVSELGHQKLRNKVANLLQSIQFLGCWNGWFFIHPGLVAGLNKLFRHFLQILRDGCEKNYENKIEPTPRLGSAIRACCRLG
jgi:hypothetical protein